MGTKQSKPDSFNTERARKLLSDSAFDYGILINPYLRPRELKPLSAVNKKSQSIMSHVNEEKRRLKILFHDPYPLVLDLSNSVWTVTLGQVKHTDDFLEIFDILVRDRDDLLEYINANTYLTHVEYIGTIKEDGTIVEEIKVTFVCENKKKIDENYIAEKIKESIDRQAEHSDGKYYENLLVKEVKLETDTSKYRFRKSKKKNLKSVQTRKTKKRSILKSLKTVKNRFSKKRSE